MKYFMFLMAMVITLLGVTGTGHADFSTAFLKTQLEISGSADADSAGNATVALKNACSTPNPAGVAATEGKYPYGISVDYGYINFGKGLNLQTENVSGTFRFSSNVVQIIFSNANSNTGEVAGGEIDNIRINRVPSVGIMYARKFSDSFSAGLSYTYSEFSADSHLTMFDEYTGESFPLKLHSESKSHQFGLGALYSWERFTFGGLYIRSQDKSKESVSEMFEITERTNADQFRAGISFQATPMTLLAIEGRYNLLPDEERSHGFFAGIEQYLVKDAVAIYGGYANGGITTGLGIYLEQGGINLSYSYRQFRDTERYLGQANSFGVLGYYNW